VFSRQFAKNYLKRVTGRLQTSEGGFVYGAVQCRRQVLRADRISQEKELLRRSEKIKSVVYVV
jgi:hypothetical protein